MTVKEIVKRAGYSRATFYHYFRDVYELQVYVEDVLINALMKNVHRHIEQERFMDYFIYDFVRFYESQSMYIQVFMSSVNHLSFLERLKHRALPLLISAFRISEDDLRAKYALEFYISGMLSTISLWIKEDRNRSVEELAQMVKGILQDGILAQLRSS